MRRYTYGLSIAMIYALLSGCAAPAAGVRAMAEAADMNIRTDAGGQNKGVLPAGAEDLLDVINREHQTVKKPEISLEDYIREASEDDFDIRPYMIDMSAGGDDFDENAPITIEQVEEDLDVLFRILQTTYGAYYYFGGDQSFHKAKEDVLNGCREAQNLTGGTLTGLLLEHLSFIRDGHFLIGGYRLDESYIPFFYKDAACEKLDEIYRSLDTGRTVASADGVGDLDGLFKRSLSEDGKIVYYPVRMRKFSRDPEDKPEDLTVRYTDGSSQKFSAARYESYYDKSDKTIDLHENQGIPVLFVRNMGFDEAKGDTLGNEFLSYAGKFKEEPVVILDLRSNGGGNGVLPFKWLGQYTGEPVTTNYISVKYWSQPDMRDYAENKDNRYYVSWESMTDIAGYESISENYIKANAQPDMFAQNENLLIILTGKNTASAAEAFVDMAHNVRNTLVIGENTYGVLTSNAYTMVALPNSGLTVQLGSDISIFPGETYFQEFVGFQPDIWTTGPDAEELAVKLVKRMQNGENLYETAGAN